MFSIATAVSRQRNRLWETDGRQKILKTDAQILSAFNNFDGHELESYAQNIVYNHVILDVVSKLMELRNVNAFESNDT